jgi:hypothetical protein
MDAGAAKQFLISKVVEQAESDHVQLSEVEKKMLHFTEVHPTLPGIYEVNAEFDRDYNSNEYEAKIAKLLKRAHDHDAQSPDREEQWKDALDARKKEDHYILVMVSQAFGSGTSGNGNRIRDSLIYLGVGVGIVLIIVVKTFWNSGR